MSDDDTRHSGSRWEPDRQDGHQDTADDRTDEVATGPADHPAEEVATEPAGDAAAPHIPLTSWPPVSDSSLFAMPPIPAVATTQPRRPRRRAGLVAAATAGLLAVGGAGGYALGHVGAGAVPATAGAAGTAGQGHHHGPPGTDGDGFRGQDGNGAVDGQ